MGVVVPLAAVTGDAGDVGTVLGAGQHCRKHKECDTHEDGNEENDENEEKEAKKIGLRQKPGLQKVKLRQQFVARMASNQLKSPTKYAPTTTTMLLDSLTRIGVEADKVVWREIVDAD